MPYEPRFLPHASERERPERVEDPTASHAARVCMWRSHNAIDALSTDTRTSRTPQRRRDDTFGCGRSYNPKSLTGRPHR